MARRATAGKGELRDETKNKIRRLARLVTDFLEHPVLNYNLDSPESIQSVIDLLEDTLETRRIVEYEDDQHVFIFMMHHLLTQFWEEVKKAIFSEQKASEVIEGEPVHSPPNVTLEMAMPVTIRINASFRRTIYFFDSCLDALKAFQNLMHGLPLEIFKKCPGCERVFVLTSRHTREYCSQRCAARDNERKKRVNRPEEFLLYHENYRRKKLGLAPLKKR